MSLIEMLLNSGMDETDIKASGIFMPYYWSRVEDAFVNDTKFVHYTRADTAMKILNSSQVWARNANCMNDFAELEHGHKCLKTSFRKHKEAIEKLFDKPFPGFVANLIKSFDDWTPHFFSETYITCLSEHSSKENELGRLSMWRAYGGNSGVAIVIKPLPLFLPTEALGAYASPVAYRDILDFEEDFLDLLKRVKKNIEFVKRLGRDQCHNYMFAALRAAMLCTKHPGFHEEREWRVVHGRNFDRTDRINLEIETIGNTPQKVAKIPLKDYPEDGLVGITINDFLDRLIIGPTDYPYQIKSAFVEVLEKLNVADASKKVVVSEIPLRN